ncbi:MAG: LptF/LptG family permease [Deltaproteobacteria bacterium]|nr:LptF/LptG family permease [Deltaproteobacteria bacterium]
MILFRYVLREYLKYVTGTVLLCLFLFILFDFIHKTTNYFARYEPSVDLILRYYVYQIPFQLVQIFPIASLLSSVVVMVLLNRSHEIAAMRAAGMTPLRMAAPLCAGGCLLMLCSFLLGELVVPLTSLKMRFVTEVLIEGGEVFATDKGAHWVRDGDKIFHFQEYDHSLMALSGIRLLSIREPFLPGQSLHAKSARWLGEQKLWRMEGARRLWFDAEGQLIRTDPIGSLEMELPVAPEKLNADRRLPDEMSLAELGERIRHGASLGADVLDLRIAWHVKLAYPLASLLISLIGLSFGYRSERKTEAVRSILLAFAMGISYWFVLSAARALAGAGDLPPFLAGWLANIMIAIVVGLQLWHVHRIRA